MQTSSQTAPPKRRVHKQKPPYTPGRFATIADLVAAGIGSRAKIYRLIEASELPKPVVIGGTQRWTPAQSEEILSGEWFLRRATATTGQGDDEV